MIEKAHSINDVARMAGVSPATVSNVLTGRKRVSAKLVKKVEAAVKALDYRTDPRASTLRSGRPRLLLSSSPISTIPSSPPSSRQSSNASAPKSYEVIVASSHGEEEDEKSRLKAMLAWRPAGLIVIPCSDEFAGRQFIEVSNTPYVIADRVTGNLSSDTVSVDNEVAGAVGARHLIDLGHKDILVVASSLRLATFGNAAVTPLRPCGRMASRNRQSLNSASQSTRRPRGSRNGSMKIRGRPRFRR